MPILIILVLGAAAIMLARGGDKTPVDIEQELADTIYDWELLVFDEMRPADDPEVLELEARIAELQALLDGGPMGGGSVGGGAAPVRSGNATAAISQY